MNEEEREREAERIINAQMKTCIYNKQEFEKIVTSFMNGQTCGAILGFSLVATKLSLFLAVPSVLLSLYH